MKKYLSLTLIGLLFALVLSACGTTGNCDAYGSVDNTENSDLASK